jgi:hypothetical protein
LIDLVIMFLVSTRSCLPGPEEHTTLSWPDGRRFRRFLLKCTPNLLTIPILFNERSFSAGRGVHLLTKGCRKQKTPSANDALSQHKIAANPDNTGILHCINFCVLIWWRRGESNPRPKERPAESLRAQFVF